MNDLKLRPLDFGKDYPVVCEWWRAHGWRYIPKEKLSQSGFVVEKNGVPVVAGWVFVTDSAWRWIDFVVANPSVIKGKKEAIKLLVTHVRDGCKEAGLELFTSVENENLISLYEQTGAIRADRGMTNMVWRLI